MKKIITFLFLVYSLQAHAQKIKTSQIILKENALYFFCRGTTGKAVITSKKFNIADSGISHIGIGFFEKGKTKIFNVSDIKNSSNNFLLIDSFGSFAGVKDIYYIAVWEYKLKRFLFNRLKRVLKNYEDKRITFDRDFNISFDDTLYCSEFCAMVLTQLKIPGLSFKPDWCSLENNILFKAYLNRNQLVYYPADFFLRNEKVKKIFEEYTMK